MAVMPNQPLKAVLHLLNGAWLEPRALALRVTDAQPSAAMRAGTAIAGRALQTQRTQYVPDTLADPDFVDRGTGLRSVLVAPLLDGGAAIGTLEVGS